MAAEDRVITKSQIAKVRELDFAQLFGENVQNLLKMLGVTRKIPVTAGTALKVLKVTGTLQSGSVAEGDIIPLSQYQTTYQTVAEATLSKWCFQNCDRTVSDAINRHTASARIVCQVRYENTICPSHKS